MFVMVLYRFIETHLEVDINSFEASIHIPDELYDWIVEISRKGIDGEVLLELLNDRCVNLLSNNIKLAQQIRNNELSSLSQFFVSESNTNYYSISKNSFDRVSNPFLADFYYSCQFGFDDFVEIYCKCNVPVNEERLDVYTGVRSYPIIIAAKNGRYNVLKLLLLYKVKCLL